MDSVNYREITEEHIKHCDHALELEKDYIGDNGRPMRYHYFIKDLPGEMDVILRHYQEQREGVWRDVLPVGSETCLSS